MTLLSKKKTHHTIYISVRNTFIPSNLVFNNALGAFATRGLVILDAKLKRLMPPWASLNAAAVIPP